MSLGRKGESDGRGMEGERVSVEREREKKERERERWCSAWGYSHIYKSKKLQVTNRSEANSGVIQGHENDKTSLRRQVAPNIHESECVKM